jgi:general secretion pathway protein G
MKSKAFRNSGFTLVEMLITMGILAILAAAILPLAKNTVKREKEIELRRNLRILRTAIDDYKKMADEKKFEIDEDTEGYPPNLEILVEGVEIKDDNDDDKKKIHKFLRRIPRDPMTNTFEWGLRAYNDDPDSTSWGGDNVYDVYTKSPGTALDGTKYREW